MQSPLQKIIPSLFLTVSCLILGYGQIAQSDSIAPLPAIETDSLKTIKDSIPPDSIHNKKEQSEALKSEIKYNARQSITHFYADQYSELIDQGDITYRDTNLKAGYIIIDWKTDKVFATGLADSTGKKTIQRPVFVQKESTIKVDSIIYDLKSEQAVIFNFNTTYEGIIYDGQKVKRISDSIFYLSNARFTTDQDEKPDYYIATKRAKLIKDDKIITGASQLYIYDVPTPLFLPFGFFPSTSNRKAGILIPTYGEQDNLGFFLQDLGYYLPIGDYVDLTTLFDFYSKGSWAANANINYALRYRFSGSLAFSYENQVRGTKGLNDFTQNRLFNLRWRHSQDSKANPNLTFSSNVNISSSQFFESSFNRGNELAENFRNNTTSSSINLSKQFENSPFSLSLSLNHSQNNRNRRIRMSLPNLTINMKRIYPFAPRSRAKKGLLEKLGVDYSFQGQNQIDIDEDLLFRKQMFDSARAGIRHNVNLNTSTKLFRYFSFSIGSRYEEHWELQTIRRRFDQRSRQVVDDPLRGFFTFRQFSFNTGLSTTVYGTKQFRPGGYLGAIRHALTPSISYNYRPDFSDISFGYFDTYLDSLGIERTYTPFERGVFGRPSTGEQSRINLGLNNNFEAKVRSKEDSTKYEKIKLLDALNINTSYNFAAESFKLGDIGINTSTRVLKDKLVLNANATISPYPLMDNNGVAVRIDEPGKAFRLTNFTLSGSYKLSNESFTKNKENKKSSKSSNSNAPDRNKSKKEKDPFTYDKDGYARFSIPWNLSLTYNFGYSKPGFDSNKRSSVDFKGNIKFSPYWSVNISSGYDFESDQFNYTRMGFHRTLRSFELRFDWVPFGSRRTYYFYFGIRANILKDLKYDQRQFRENNPPF